MVKEMMLQNVPLPPFYFLLCVNVHSFLYRPGPRTAFALPLQHAEKAVPIFH